MNSRNCNTCWLLYQAEIHLSDRKKITLNRSYFPSFNNLKTHNTEDQAVTQEKQNKIRKKQNTVKGTASKALFILKTCLPQRCGDVVIDHSLRYTTL